MPIISSINQKSRSGRMITLMIYALLLIGSVTMVYPFLLMISGGTKSGVDTPEAQVIPEYMRSEAGLYRKHMEAFFNEDFEMFKWTYASDFPSFRKLLPPQTPNERFVREWEDFLRNSRLPHHYYMTGSWSVSTSRGVVPSGLRSFKAMMFRKFDGDICIFNKEMLVDVLGWNYLAPSADNFLVRRCKISDSPLSREISRFKESTPLGERYYFSPEGFYKKAFLQNQYGKDIHQFNSGHGTSYASWSEVHLHRNHSAGRWKTPKEQRDWEVFVRDVLNLLWIRVDTEASPQYRNFLEAKYGDIGSLNKTYGVSFSGFDEITISSEAPKAGMQMSDWESFLKGWSAPNSEEVHRMPIEHIRIDSVEFMFGSYLREKFREVSKANETLGTKAEDWADFLPPQADFHYLCFRENVNRLRWEYSTRNLRVVFDFFLFHGKALRNTAIYCILAIIAALTVNPIAAYALSRYRPPSTYKILLLLMLTMAFPPMVTQIPLFIMMRKFNLLNTFAALILPGLANGYSIFLLKGFFDSLPRELYESAAIDGAGEFTMFWNITMRLSTPILAVVALNAFTHSYGNFMFALLICQDQSMWTLMPWLYQLQLQNCQGLVFSSLLVAAIPTFIIFTLCQNVIMKGIVVPVEK